jgi:hypothetical protein
MSDIKPDVFIATPTHNWMVSTSYTQSLMATVALLGQHGMAVLTNYMLGCAMISFARAIQTQDFLDSGAEHLLFIDSDLEWDPLGALALVTSPHDFIGGVYPAKTAGMSMMFQTRNIRESGSQNLIETDGIPGGFFRITRKAVLAMKEAYPEMQCNYKGREIYLLFETIITDGDRQALGEDYAFCERWRRMGNKIFIYPDITFSHFGMKEWKGNMIENDKRLSIVP